MKRFLIKLTAFVLLYTLANGLVSILVPYHWGNPWFSSKIDYLEDSETRFDTFFFGSSLVYRQVDPQVFDQTVRRLTGDQITSFNLGAAATFCPQNYYLYENFLDSPLSDKVEYAFIELMEVDLIDDFFMHQERTTYWQNLGDLVFVIRSVARNPDLDFQKKREAATRYITSYFESIYHLGHFGQQMLKRDYYDVKYVGEEANGYFPVERDLETTEDQEVRDHFITRRDSFLRNPKLLEGRASMTRTFNRRVSDHCDRVHLERIERLIARSEERGTQLFFILSPRNASQELVNLLSCIPDGHAIDLSNPDQYPQFYRNSFTFDIGHLNIRGSKAYSKALAQAFIRLRE